VTAVSYRLVERLELFERWLGIMWRAVAEMFDQPPMGGAPGSGGLLAEFFCEIRPDVWMCVERDDRPGVVAVDREQARGFEAAQALLPIVVA
jgi:hypothetical protein